jgi:hypothetical protein
MRTNTSLIVEDWAKLNPRLHPRRAAFRHSSFLNYLITDQLPPPLSTDYKRNNDDGRAQPQGSGLANASEPKLSKVS